jgi:hypothetical protein
VDPATYDAAPSDARDPERPFLVRWGFIEQGADPFLAGARWAQAWAYDFLFGALLGALFLDAQNVETYDVASGRWVPSST